MTLTDGNKTVEISKEDMELLLEGLHDRRHCEEMCFGAVHPDSPLEVLIYKLESLDF